MAPASAGEGEAYCSAYTGYSELEPICGDGGCGSGSLPPVAAQKNSITSDPTMNARWPPLTMARTGVWRSPSAQASVIRPGITIDTGNSMIEPSTSRSMLLRGD